MFGPEFYFGMVKRKEGRGKGGKGESVHTAMESNPGASCFSVKFSSAKNFVP